MEEQIKALVDPIYREKVLRARQLSVGERIATGIQLFEDGLKNMRSIVAKNFPEADAKTVDKMVEERLNLLRVIEDKGVYFRSRPT